VRNLGYCVTGTVFIQVILVVKTAAFSDVRSCGLLELYRYFGVVAGRSALQMVVAVSP
jgi:hypothetical protein